MTSVGRNLGTLTIAANGSYTYSVANCATQYLGANDTKTETFTVTALDGTTKQVSFTIHGKNDAAVIGTPTVRDVTEDASNPSLDGNRHDLDLGCRSGPGRVQDHGDFGRHGNLGTLSLDANGSYTYSVANSAVDISAPATPRPTRSRLLRLTAPASR